MNTLIVEPDAATADTLLSAIGGDAQVLNNLDHLRQTLADHPELAAVVIGPTVDKTAALAFTEAHRIVRPTMGVILVRSRLESGVLKEALRAGAREVVGDRDLAALAEAVQHTVEVSMALRHASGEPVRPPDERSGTVITVFAAKGGCGKTTFATNLAAVLANGGAREVCLVDLDLAFGDVAITLQLFPAHTIADAIPLGAGIDAPAVRSLLTPHSPGLCALVAPTEPGTAESIPATTVADILSILRTQFEYVVVDSPPAFTDHVLAAFDESDVVALLATLDIPALKNLKLTLETLELLNYPRDRWKVVLNRADSKVGLSLTDVEKTLRMGISAQIPSSRAVPASVNRGVPIVLEDPNHPVSVSVRQFAEQHVLATRQRAGAAAIPDSLRTDRRGLLRRKAKHS